MNKSVQYLALALIAQCLILATVLFSTQNESFEKENSLLEFDKSAITELVIGDSAGELSLIKNESEWTLPSYANLPVKTDRVEEVLEDLKNIHITWPVATSKEAATRFEVAMDNAQKSVKLKNGKEILAKLYFGTSPGFRKVHVRTGESDDIYAAEFSQHKISTKGEDWFNRKVLAYSGTITKVLIGDIEISKLADQWKVAGLDAESVDVTKVSDWVNNLNSLSVVRLIQGNDRDKLLVLDANFSVLVEGDQGAATYQFWKKGETFYVKRTDVDTLFEVANYEAEKYQTLNIDNFRKLDTLDDAGDDAGVGAPESPNSF